MISRTLRTGMKTVKGVLLTTAFLLSWTPGLAAAQGLDLDIETGGKLLLTRGITNVGGAAGGGITPWAVIAGNETDRGIGGTAHYTRVDLPDYTFEAYGAAAGFYNRFEVSYTRQHGRSAGYRRRLHLPSGHCRGESPGRGRRGLRPGQMDAANLGRRLL